MDFLPERRRKMIRKHLKVLIITSAIILLPILAGIILWKRLPEQLPIHWNAAGEIDGWCGKAFAVFGLPAILLTVQWLGTLVTFADPKKSGHSGKILQLVFWLIPVMSLVLNTITYTTALGIKVPVNVVMPVFMGLLFIIIGNYMPKCKQNYTIGIKIPWTLNSEENWNKTHRFAGRLWVICGFILMASSFFGKVWICIAAIVPIALIPMVYSYILHCRGV